MIQSIVIRMTHKHQMTATTVTRKKKTHISHMHMLGKSQRITAVTDKKDKKKKS